MKAAQITQYTKNIRIKVNNVPIPKMGDHDVLIRVKAAAVNPVDILNLTGAVRLIQDYRMPLTLGNECAGIVEKAGKTGRNVVYSRRLRKLRSNGSTNCEGTGATCHRIREWACKGRRIVPQIDSRKFDLMQINDAVRLVHEGHTNGKVIVRFP